MLKGRKQGIKGKRAYIAGMGTKGSRKFEGHVVECGGYWKKRANEMQWGL
jgi:hypothetical protein